MNHDFVHTIIVNDEEIEVCINITSYTPFYPGRYDGPWEDCEPDISPEAEFDVYCDEVLRNDLLEYVSYETVLDEAEKYYKDVEKDSYYPEDNFYY